MTTIAGRIVTPDNVLSGTVQIEADRIAAITADRALGIDAELGSLQPGKLADLAVLDQDYNCIATFINGKLIHDAR